MQIKFKKPPNLWIECIIIDFVIGSEEPQKELSHMLKLPY